MHLTVKYKRWQGSINPEITARLSALLAFIQCWAQLNFMAEIIAKLTIKRVEEWSTDWENYKELRNELEKLKYDMKMAIYERCGVDLDKIEIELSLSD